MDVVILSPHVHAILQPVTMWIILLDPVIITPSMIVAPVDSNRSYTFTCLSPIEQREGGIASIQWLINGVLLEDLNLTNVNSAFVGGAGDGGFGLLTLSRVQLDQNSTSVTCTVHFMSGRVANFSVSLLLQG